MKETKEPATTALRVGHLLRIRNYLGVAMLSMWRKDPRAVVTMGMARASAQGKSPGGKDEELLEDLRALIGEAIDYYEKDDFPAAMARMRVASDLASLNIVRLAGE